MNPNKLRDMMGNAGMSESANAAMTVADRIQCIPDKGARLMGLCAAFLLASEAAGLPVTDLMVMTKNCVNNADGRRPEFRAVTDYINHEIFN